MNDPGKNPFTGVPLVQMADRSVPAPLVDDAGGGVTYLGFVKRFGVLETDEEWHVQRVTQSGTLTTTEYAGGGYTYKFTWTDRATLTYSR